MVLMRCSIDFTFVPFGCLVISPRKLAEHFGYLVCNDEVVKPMVGTPPLGIYAYIKSDTGSAAATETPNSLSESDLGADASGVTDGLGVEVALEVGVGDEVFDAVGLAAAL